jgi:hypothetical protein
MKIRNLAFISGCFIALLFILSSLPAVAQDTLNSRGHLYGLMFGDFYYKAHADSMRRGTNQYAGIPAGKNAFDFRRIYLGYRYDISSRFTANLLMESTYGGAENKLSLYIKYANIKWKNIFPRTDFVIGQMKTPTFSTLTDKVWGYRSVEKTITDMHGSPSYDFGAALFGHFDEKERFGYSLMVGNGSGAKIEDDKYKKFYGEVYAKLLDEHFILDLYADYERLDWRPGFHHAQNMLKGFAAYSLPAFTVGVETFIQNMQNGLIRQQPAKTDTTNARAFGLALFVRGKLIKDKLGFFARADNFNPYVQYDGSGKYDYRNFSQEYNPNSTNIFITAGLDFSPVNHVHFIPNVWYSRYRSQLDHVSGKMDMDHDLVYRVTFYYVYE